ncbi:MAG: hypothetical protein AABY53_03435 [Bdellovibrionota bacterium]
MSKVDRREELADFDEDATEGQMADYFMAEATGDYGNWAVGIVEYFCKSCDSTVELTGDNLESYNGLIIGWHNKAKHGDYFSRFVFEYLSFTALLKNKIAIEANSDRQAIQSLKQNQLLKNSYLRRITNNEELASTWKKLIKELKCQPLYNSSRDLDYPEIDKWWNSDGQAPVENKLRKGVVHTIEDWTNMIEFWNGVRNNLFHGGKSPNIQRDAFLVEHAYKTISIFVSQQLKRL